MHMKISLKKKRFIFNNKDLLNLYKQIEIPSFYSDVNLKENDYRKYANKLLSKYKIKLTESQLQKLGKFIVKSLVINKNNIKVLHEALNNIEKAKTKKISKYKSISNKVDLLERKLLNEYEEEEVKATAEKMKKEVKRKAEYIKISKAAEIWKNNIKFVGLLSFVVTWYKGVKGPPDVIDADEIGNKLGFLKRYFNKAVFSIPESSLMFVKKHYEQFQPGFYEYLEYIFDKVEKVKSDEEKKYAADRTVFILTSAKNLAEIDFDKNTIAINTNGTDRPMFKGTPDKLTNSDLKRAIKYTKTHPNIPTAGQAGGGGGGGGLF